MTFNKLDRSLPRTLQAAWARNVGWKVPLIAISVLVIFVIWESPPPSFLEFYSLSASQSLLGVRESNRQAPTNTASNSSTPSSVSTLHAMSESNDAQPKKPPILTIPSNGFPINSTTTHGFPISSTAPSESATNSTDITGLAVAEEEAQGVFVSSAGGSRASANLTISMPEMDKQLKNASTIQVQDDVQHPEKTKYLVPLLRFISGTGNQLIEYKSAAVIARTLNRTLCLVPFFDGPKAHFGTLGNSHLGLAMEERYDTEVLSKFVNVVSMNECVQQCNWKVDVHWRLRNLRPPRWSQWAFNDTPKTFVDFVTSSKKWSSTADLVKSLGPRNDAHCVGLGEMFPGLPWRGVSIAASTYMEHSQKVKKAADLLQARALPGSSDNNYVSIHWRFEELKCRGHPLGLCFSRTKNGSGLTSGRLSETWANMTRESPKDLDRQNFTGVFMTREDISGAIHDRAVKWGVKNVYLATDGWLRGAQSKILLKWVVEDIRSKGLNVAGLWMLEGLPNFADGFEVGRNTVAEVLGLGKNQNVSNHIVALVEQEICLRSADFVGSGYSTWSLAIADTRRGRRCKQELSEGFSKMNSGDPPEEIEQIIIDKMLTIQNEAGPTCSGAGSNFTMESSVDEIPDGWLDFEACEVRLLSGVGQCKKIAN